MADVKISQLPQAALPLVGTEVFPVVQNGVTVQAPVGSIGSVATISDLRSITPVAGVFNNVDGYYAVGDGGGGQFYAVTGAATGTYTDNGGSVIVPNGGDGSAAWIRVINGPVSVKAFGAVDDGVTDNTTVIQRAIDYGYFNGIPVYVPGGPYVISTLYINGEMTGSVFTRFGGLTGATATAAPSTTFISTATAGNYALVMGGGVGIPNNSIFGSLENITLTLTGGGNGINCQNVSARMPLSRVAVITLYPLVTGSGSIGVNFGTDFGQGAQAITCVFDTVMSRGFDIGFRMRYYSNNNVYRKLYALQTATVPGSNPAVPLYTATNGFLISGRGGIYEGCGAETYYTNPLQELATYSSGGVTYNGAEENLYTNIWLEQSIAFTNSVQGIGSVLIAPYGFTGTATYPIDAGPYVTIVKKKPSVTDADFRAGVNRNLLVNSEFANGLGGVNWGTATAGATPIFGYNAINIYNATPSSSITIDCPLTNVDIAANTWLIGRNITFSCFGQAETGVTMSMRACVRNAAGNTLQLGTAEPFSTTAPSQSKVTLQIPATVSGQPTKYLVFRVVASVTAPATITQGGRIALPMVFLGNDLQDTAPKLLSDGANTVYGDQSLVGQLALRTAAPVATATSAGAAGDIRWGVDAGTTHLYICIAANTWRRVALAVW